MVVVTLACREDGVVQDCKANGHAGFAGRGDDIVCAAVTVLLRTAGTLLSELSESGAVGFGAEARRRGELSLHVEADAARGNVRAEERLRCIADFIRAGIGSLEAEHPECVRLVETREKIVR